MVVGALELDPRDHWEVLARGRAGVLGLGLGLGLPRARVRVRAIWLGQC